jgi:hypothetical protein
MPDFDESKSGNVRKREIFWRGAQLVARLAQIREPAHDTPVEQRQQIKPFIARRRIRLATRMTG